MARAVSPSNEKSVTKGQAGKFSDLLVSALVKSALPSEPTQIVLEQQGQEIVTQFVAMVRERVEFQTGLVVRTVKVNRTRSGADAVKATGRTVYANDAVVASMQHGNDDEVEIVFFPIKRTSSNKEVLARYEASGLMPVDPFALCDYNAVDPAFADTHPNATIWDSNCYAAFGTFDGDRGVYVLRHDNDWYGRWWFAGVRKSTSTSTPPL